jgi:hypothetical protein
MREGLRGSLVLGAVVLLGCPTQQSMPDAGPGNDGGTDAGMDAGVDGGSAADSCRARAQVVCHAFAACPQSSQLFDTQYANEAECVAGFTTGCLTFLPGPTLPGSSLNIFDDNATCTAALAQNDLCDTALRLIYGSNRFPITGCFPSPGTLMTGDPCIDPRQCASSYCQFRDNCGRCADRAAAGQSCAINQDCAFDSACINGLCRNYAQSGASCSATAPCNLGETCQSGKCKPLVDAGSACDPRQPSPCNFGYCGLTDSICHTIPNDLKPGDPCGYDSVTGEISACGIGSVCVLINQASQGLCVDRVEPGGRCFFATGFQGGQCDVNSFCVNGVCTTPGDPLVCSSDGGTVTPPKLDAGVIAIDAGTDVATTFAAGTTLFCDALFACTRFQGIAASAFPSRAACEPTLGLQNAYVLSAPDTDRTVANVTACTTALMSMSTCAVADALQGVGTPTECKTPGTLPAGSVCTGDAQCAAGTRCPNDALSKGCGVCIPIQGDGGTCVVNDDCAAGLSCTNEACVPAGGVGATCNAGAPCDRLLRCFNGTCQAQGDVGDSCSPSTGGCLVGLFCNTVSSLCEQIRVVGTDFLPDGGLTDAGLPGDGGIVGQTCGLLNGSLVLCPAGTECKVTNAQTHVGFCDVGHLLGESCDWADGLDGRGQCQFPGRCVNGICLVGDQSYCQ